MTVRAVWVAGARLTVTGVGYTPEGQFLDERQSTVQRIDDDVRWLLIAAGLCNDARLLPPSDAAPHWMVLGDPTEAALLVAARKGGVDFAAQTAHTPRLRELPFDSRRKRMSTIHRVLRTEERGLNKDTALLSPQSSSLIAYVKGAPREVLALCTEIWQDGRACRLDEQTRATIMRAN